MGMYETTTSKASVDDFGYHVKGMTVRRNGGVFSFADVTVVLKGPSDDHDIAGEHTVRIEMTPLDGYVIREHVLPSEEMGGANPNVLVKVREAAAGYIERNIRPRPQG